MEDLAVRKVRVMESFALWGVREFQTRVNLDYIRDLLGQVRITTMEVSVRQMAK